MNRTMIPDTKKRTAQILIQNGPLLAQVGNQLGGRRYLAGKDAYDYLGNMLTKPVTEIRSCLSHLGLSSVATRDLDDDVEAALAVAAAAILDSSKGVRATVTEQLERAMRMLDDELAAGW